MDGSQAPPHPPLLRHTSLSACGEKFTVPSLHLLGRSPSCTSSSSTCRCVVPPQERGEGTAEREVGRPGPLSPLCVQRRGVAGAAHTDPAPAHPGTWRQVLVEAQGELLDQVRVHTAPTPLLLLPPPSNSQQGKGEQTPRGHELVHQSQCKSSIMCKRLF